jgi:Na+-transporting methylmalonyl-CoA/oxaloacetate decarboxylase gamma subunit
MDTEALLLQSLQLLGLGMGAVFIILVALIVIISIVSKLVPEEVTAVPAVTEPEVDPAHIAAISAALHLHRKNR